MVVKCCIEFDGNPHGVYFAGQVLAGKITLTADKPKHVKGILLQIHGYAFTRWTESKSNSNSNSSSTSETYTESEWYINTSTYLKGGEHNTSSTTVEPGIHVYNFAHRIPPNCPSSFESVFGHVRYTIVVSLVRPLKFDTNFRQPFTVLKIMDLNYNSPLLKLPSHYEAVKVFCCGPFKNQPLQFQISLPQSGFVPGQNIPVSVLVQNESKIPVELVKIELVMMAHFVAQRRTRNQRTVLTKYKTEEGVLRHTNKRFDCALPVPATPPTCMNLCRLIQIMYQIEVEIKVKGWYRNQLLCAPVTIGNVPFVQMPQMINQQPMPSSSPPGAFSNDGMKSVEMHAVSTIDVTDASAPSAPATPWADSIEPPSYESAQFMSSANLNNSEEHTYGPSEFVPRYPVFNVPSPDIPAAEDVNEVFVPPTSSKGTWL